MRIYTRADLEGGGSGFGQFIWTTIADLNLQPGRAFDWCSGFGTIGLGLLRNGLCSSLALGDINPEALALARMTIEANDLQNVTLYETDSLDQIPSSEIWDLVVGNPPHFEEEAHILRRRHRFPDWPMEQFHERIYRDPDWNIHRRFFARIDQHLAPEGVIVLCENWRGARPETFAPMIESAGMTFDVVDSEDCYFNLVIRRR